MIDPIECPERITVPLIFSINSSPSWTKISHVFNSSGLDFAEDNP